jgi:predicted lysophospholipase L1 biosynthesis ABC-type transport system permease subunit
MSARLARAAVAFGLTVLLLTVLVMALVRWTDQVPPRAPQLHQVTCAEDDPCWRCESMGNRQCGPLVP